MSKRLELQVTTGDLSGKRFAVPDAGLSVGRSSSNALHIPDEELSRNHCLFQPDGETGLKVLDLASANGTFVNGEQIGMEAKVLKAGDVVSIGASELRVVGEEKPAAVVAPSASLPAGGEVDLGLGPAPVADAAAATADDPAEKAKAKRRMIINISLAVLLAVMALAVLLIDPKKVRKLFSSSEKEEDEAKKAEIASVANQTFTIDYERVEATPSRIIRYAARLSGDDVSLNYDVQSNDLPNCQKFEKKGKLSDFSKERLTEIFGGSDWDALEDRIENGESVSASNMLKSWRLRVVHGGKVKEYGVENKTVPETFARICADLENRINSDLEASMSLRSADECLKASREQEAKGDEMIKNAEVSRGNLWEGLNMLKRARNELTGLTAFYEHQNRLTEKIDAGEAKLKAEYDKLLSEAKQSYDTGVWERAREAYMMICELIPDASDGRHVDAERKLLDIAGHLGGSKKGRNR